MAPRSANPGVDERGGAFTVLLTVSPSPYRQNTRGETLKRRPRQSERMELRVIEKTDEELRIEVAGEGHTFMNV